MIGGQGRPRKWRIRRETGRVTVIVVFRNRKWKVEESIFLARARYAFADSVRTESIRNARTGLDEGGCCRQISPEIGLSGASSSCLCHLCLRRTRIFCLRSIIWLTLHFKTCCFENRLSMKRASQLATRWARLRSHCVAVRQSKKRALNQTHIHTWYLLLFIPVPSELFFEFLSIPWLNPRHSHSLLLGVFHLIYDYIPCTPSFVMPHRVVGGDDTPGSWHCTNSRTHAARNTQHAV